jgi:hypothetical protein
MSGLQLTANHHPLQLSDKACAQCSCWDPHHQKIHPCCSFPYFVFSHMLLLFGHMPHLGDLSILDLADTAGLPPQPSTGGGNHQRRQAYRTGSAAPATPAATHRGAQAKGGAGEAPWFGWAVLGLPGTTEAAVRPCVALHGIAGAHIGGRCAHCHQAHTRVRTRCLQARCRAAPPIPQCLQQPRHRTARQAHVVPMVGAGAPESWALRPDGRVLQAAHLPQQPATVNRPCTRECQPDGQEKRLGGPCVARSA